MKIRNPVTPSLYKLIFVASLVAVLIISDSPAVSANTQASVNSTASPIAPGYSVLKLLLEDEQHLTFIRRTQMVITFDSIGDHSARLIDAISDSSERDLEKLEKLATAKPVFLFEEFSDDAIGKATLDSLRMTTAKEFLFESDDFEKNLLLSQLKVLRVISHLAIQLEHKETNAKRKKWLNKISNQYEDYYQQVNARITITNKDKT